MNTRKAIGLGIGAIVLFFLITQLVGAAATVRGVLDALENGATANHHVPQEPVQLTARVS